MSANIYNRPVRRLWFNDETNHYVQTLSDEEVRNQLYKDYIDVSNVGSHEAKYLDQLLEETRMALNLGKPKKGGFKYKPLTSEQMDRQATRRMGGGGDSAIRSDISEFRPKAGEHEIRIMPPNWEDADHFGIDVWLHNYIGPEGSAYVCMRKMKDEDCAVCAARVKAINEGEDEFAKKLSPQLRVAFYMIDRKEEKKGPIVWLSPAKKVNQEIVLQARDKRSGKYLNLEDPENGYDIEFTITGQRLKTTYSGVKAARSSTPLSDNEKTAETWLAFIEENPLPDIIIYPDYDVVAKAIAGGVMVFDKEEEEEDAPAVSKPKVKPSVKPKVKEPEPDPEEEEAAEEKQEEEEEEEQGGGAIFDASEFTWEDIYALDEADTEKLIADAKLEEKDFAKCKELSDYHDVICQRLGIRPPKERSAKEEPKEEEGGSWKDKLKKLKAEREKK